MRRVSYKMHPLPRGNLISLNSNKINNSSSNSNRIIFSMKTNSNKISKAK